MHPKTPAPCIFHFKSPKCLLQSFLAYVKIDTYLFFFFLKKLKKSFWIIFLFYFLKLVINSHHVQRRLFKKHTKLWFLLFTSFSAAAFPAAPTPTGILGAIASRAPHGQVPQARPTFSHGKSPEQGEPGSDQTSLQPDSLIFACCIKAKEQFI